MSRRRLLSFISITAIAILLSSSCSSIIYSQKPFFNNETQNTFNILYPLSTVPVFVKKESNFTINFESDNFDSLYAYISTAYEPIVDEVWLDIENVWKTGSTWHATVAVPINTSEELYNLTLITDKNGEFFYASQPRAVSVVNDFSDSFNFIHVSDLHFGDIRGFTVDIQKTIGWKSIKKCIDEVNLLHPDFVIITGDLVFGQLYPFEYSWEYKKCYELIQQFDVPTFLCPGNHDGYFKFGEDGFELWKEYFGPLYYSFDYGNYHFVSINSYDWPPYSRRAILFATLNWGGSIQDEQLEWIEDDLSQTMSNLTFLFLHHNPLWDTKTDSIFGREYHNRKELLSLIETFDVDMVLAGHEHEDNITIVNETIFVTTTTPSSDVRREDGYWGYRLIEMQNGSISSYNYKEPKYSIPSYRLNCTFSSPYKAKVENDLEKDVEVQLEFVLPLGNYSTDKGTITLQRQNEYMTEIYVEVTVEKESNSTITISNLL